MMNSGFNGLMGMPCLHVKTILLFLLHKTNKFATEEFINRYDIFRMRTQCLPAYIICCLLPLALVVLECPLTPTNPIITKKMYNICTMLDQRRRPWADAVHMLCKCFVFSGKH